MWTRFSCANTAWGGSTTCGKEDQARKQEIDVIDSGAEQPILPRAAVASPFYAAVHREELGERLADAIAKRLEIRAEGYHELSAVIEKVLAATEDLID